MYAVEFLSVIPAFDADALPSISPSEIKSKNVTNCLLCKVSGVLVGCGGGEGFEPPPPEPRIIFVLSVLPELAPYQFRQK